MPGSTDYYGDDSNGSAVIGAVAGVGALQSIDGACGPTGKAVYDAAQIADPEIDYSDFDTDKDGVVDFFMMIFAGLGGNGDSQLNGTPPYDNIWPHSSDLRDGYLDQATGLTGYISDDQLRDLEDRPLWYTDASRQETTTTNTGDALKVFVRVGPYNVNPESAVTKASVISHEYGHSLGLPDYYSTGSRGTYGSWTLMATDYSQNIDVIGKKELGWVIPRVLAPNTKTNATNWQDTKKDTDRIDWETPDGTPYSLQGAGVQNGEGYTAALPGRQILDPGAVPSGRHVYFSGSGNDYGCPPSGGHNLDIALPGLASVPAGTPVKLEFKSRFDIEWDYDYGFVMTTTDNGKSYSVAAVGAGLHDARHAEPQRERLPAEVRQRDHRLARLLRQRDRCGRPGARQLRRAEVRRRLLRPLRLRGQGDDAALRLRDRPRAGAAGLVHRRRQGDRRRPGHLPVRPGDAERHRDLQRRLQRQRAADRAEVHRRLDLHHRRRGLAGRARLPDGDARPLRLRRPRAERVRPRRPDVPAGDAPHLHRREPRLRQRRHRRPAGAEPAGHPARARGGGPEPRRRGLHRGEGRLELLRLRPGSRRQLHGPEPG